MDRLRVALTIEQCWHEVPGGTAVAALGMARGVAATGDAEVVGVSASHRSPPPEPWVPPFEVRSLPLPRIALYESWHRLRAPKVERATGRVDVIHATSFPTPPRSAPVVLTIHDLAWLEDPSHFTPRGLSFFRRGLDLALRDADLVTCPSEATRADCVRHGFAPERVRVIPLGVERDEASPEQVGDVKKRHGLDRPYVLWAGTIEPRKNLGGLLAAYRQLEDDVDLVLAGPQGWNEDLDALLGAKSYGRERVHVLGFVPAADLPPLYAGASVFCFPSFMEGFGFPVLEAMAQGTPVVTSSGTSTQELAEGAGILVDPRDPESIAAGMAAAMERRAELAAAGRERAKRYTWERTGRMLVDAYREVS